MEASVVLNTSFQLKQFEQKNYILLGYLTFVYRNEVKCVQKCETETFYYVDIPFQLKSLHGSDFQFGGGG